MYRQTNSLHCFEKHILDDARVIVGECKRYLHVAGDVVSVNYVVGVELKEAWNVKRN